MCLVVLLAFPQPTPAGDRSPRSRPLGLELWSSALAEWSCLGLSGSLSPPPAGGADVDHSSAVISLDFDWFSSSFVLALTWNFRVLEGRASFPYARCNPLLHRSLGFYVGFSPALFLPFSLLCYSRVFFTTKLDLSNFLEGQTVHRLPSVHDLWSRRYYGTYSSWLE